MVIADKDELRNFAEAILRANGMQEESARLSADVLLAADLRGIDSHGVARLSGYVRLKEKGRANFNPTWKIIHETPSTATLDADSGLGLTSAQEAMRIAIQKATQCGTGWVSVCNSNHFGIAAYHAMLALPHDMIGIAMTNASPLVAPTFSNERMLGTNPICYAFPAIDVPPIVVDMATSAAANGKLEIAQRTGKSIPIGWVQTSQGEDSVNPEELKSGGSLLPLGGHKGYGLGAIVDILSAVLSGANYGPWVPPFVSFLEPLSDLPGTGIGHFLGAMRVDAFRPKTDYYNHIHNWINRFKQSQRINSEQEVLIPGEPEYRETILRSKNGIPLTAAVANDLEQLSQRFSIPARWS